MKQTIYNHGVLVNSCDNPAHLPLAIFQLPHHHVAFMDVTMQKPLTVQLLQCLQGGCSVLTLRER